MKIPKAPIPKPPTPIPKPPIPKPPVGEYIRNEELLLNRGRVMPCAIDLEEVVLGAMMIDKKGVNEVIQILSPDVFFEQKHALIYRAMLNLYDKQVAIDLLTVSTELKRLNKLAIIGGDYYLISLTQKVFSSAHIEYHARIILQKYMLRMLINHSNIVIDQAYYHDPDVFDIMDGVEENISNIHKVAVQTDDVDVSTDAKAELYAKVKAVEAGDPPGVATGVEEFDDWCGGFQKRELITIAARPSMGKTSVILSILNKGSIEKGIPMAFFSLEMAVADLKSRLAAKGTGIDYNKIRQGKLEYSELNKVLEYYDFIDASKLVLVERMTFHEKICNKIRDLVLKNGIKLVAIDYVQLVRLTKRTSDKTADIGIITADLKALANELNIPIVILAQLSRKADDRPGHRPVYADLKWAGSIEEDSDTVTFLLRHSFYQQQQGMILPPHEVGKCEWIVAKGRSIGVRDFKTFIDFNNYDFRSQVF
jgi:replicative DNA helicase